MEEAEDWCLTQLFSIRLFFCLSKVNQTHLICREECRTVVVRLKCSFCPLLTSPRITKEKVGFASAVDKRLMFVILVHKVAKLDPSYQKAFELGSGDWRLECDVSRFIDQTFSRLPKVSTFHLAGVAQFWKSPNIETPRVLMNKFNVYSIYLCLF